MHQLCNHTPFAAALDIFPDPRGSLHLYVTLKATFQVGPALQVHAKQRPVLAADVYDDATGCLRYPGERHLAKPGTDVLVLGHAYAPDARPATSVDVTLALGPIRKVVRVVGDRQWQRDQIHASPPTPFIKLPLSFARAFGGPAVAHNPVGVGHRGENRPQPGSALPNLEDPRHPFVEHGDATPVVGFGPVAPGWSPRSELAGTYDTAWQRQRAPFLPDDFDPRYFHAAPSDQVITPHLCGGELLELQNAAPAPLRVHLPAVTWNVTAQLGRTTAPLEPKLETVGIEPDDACLCLVWRAALALDRRVHDLDTVTIDVKHLQLQSSSP